MKTLCLFRPATASSSEDRLIENFAEACYRLTPLVAVRPGQAVFLDLTGLREPTIVRKRLNAVAKKFFQDHKFFISEGRDPAVAFAIAAFSPNEKDWGDLSVRVLSEISRPFEKIDPDEKQASEFQIRRLRDLGIETLRAFLALPPQMVASRLGREMARIHDVLSYGFCEPWPRFQIPHRITEDVHCTDPETGFGVRGLEPMLFVLKIVCDRVSARLRARGKRASRLELRWQTSRGISAREALSLAVAQSSARGLHQIVAQFFEERSSRSESLLDIATVTLTVMESIAGAGAQKSFFDSSEIEAESWWELEQRLKMKLGQTNVFSSEHLPTHRPEKSWKRGPVHKDAFLTPHPPIFSNTQLRGDRPTRVLTNPEPITRRGDWMHTLGRIWKAESWQGPERLVGDWWQKNLEPMARDYFRVRTFQGQDLWVFQDLGAQDGENFYLHGFFD